MERHDTDPVALFFGLVFLVAGSLFFFGAEVGSMSPDWVLPSALVGLGLIVAAVTLSLASRGSARSQPITATPSDSGTSSAEEAAMAAVGGQEEETSNADGTI